MQHTSQKPNLVLFITFVAVTQPNLERYTLMASSLTLILCLVISSLYFIYKISGGKRADTTISSILPTVWPQITFAIRL